MKEYKKPSIEIENIEIIDVISTSSINSFDVFDGNEDVVSYESLFK